MEAVRINELSMGYRDTLVLDDLELAIPAGSMVGLLGPNGAGKTTLLKILAGLEMAYQGEVKICGSVPGPTSKAKVSYQPDHLPLAKDMRVKETTALYETFFEDFDTKRANFMIRRLGLDRESRIREMSKGMRDKLQIALTLSRRAEVYLLDEPIGGVDPAARSGVIDAILDGFDDGATLIISTHMVADIEPLIDRAVFLGGGKALLNENVETLRAVHGKGLEEIFREVYDA